MSRDRVRQREASADPSARQRAPTSAPTRPARNPEAGTRPPANACPCAGGCPRCLAPEGGQPLAQDVRERMEATLDHDFSRVRLHMGAGACDVAESFDAQAVTRGTHIWFDPNLHGTPDGDRVLFHELTHVRQYETGALVGLPDGGVVPEAHPLERQAQASETPRRHQWADASAPVPGHVPASRGTPTPILLKRKTREAAELDEIADPELERLLDRFRRQPRRAVKLLPELAGYHPLEPAVARLDAEALLEPLFEHLGGHAWEDAYREAVLRVLAVRSPERNAETLTAQVRKGLLPLDLRITGDEARWVYEILKAMTPEQRGEVLVSEASLATFDRFPVRKHPGVRIRRQIEFSEEDTAALLTGIENPDAWLPGNDAWLRVLLWLARHHADEAIAAELATRWETHGGLLASIGFDPSGAVTAPIKETPGGLGLFGRGAGPLMEELAGEGLAVSSADGGDDVALVVTAQLGKLAIQETIGPRGVFKLALRVLLRRWSKKKAARVENLELADVQKLLGNSVLGMRLDDLEGDLVEGTVALELNPRMGFAAVALDDAVVPTLAWGGDTPSGPLNVTAYGVRMEHLEFSAKWPRNRSDLGAETMRMERGSIAAERVVVSSSGVESAVIENLTLDNLAFSLEMGQFKQGKRVGTLGMARHIQDQLSALGPVIPAAVGALVSTGRPESQTTPADFIGQLAEVLRTELDGSLLLQSDGVASLHADSVLVDGVAHGSIDTGFELLVHVGARPLAILEQRALEAQEILGTEDRARLFALRRVGEMTDRERADEMLEMMGLEPDNLVMQLTTSGLEIGESNVPAIPLGVDTLESEDPVTITVTVPGVVADESDEKAQPNDVLYTVAIAAPGTMDLAAPRGPPVEGSPLVSGPLTLEGVSGTATVFRDGRIGVEANIAAARFQKIDWGRVVVSAADGRAWDVSAAGTVEMGPDGFVVSEDAPLQIKVGMATGSQIDIAVTNLLEAKLLEPQLLGLSAVLARGRLPTLHVESGSVAGFEGLLNSVLGVSSDTPLEFEHFDTTAMIDLGVLPFSFGKLISGEIDWTLYGEKLIANRLDGVPILTTALAAAGVSGRIEELGDGRVRVVAGVEGASFGKVDWGGYVLAAVDGVATGVALGMELEKGEVAGEIVATDIGVDIEVTELGATKLDVEVPDTLRATLRNPVLHGLRAGVAKGEIPKLHVDSGVVSGFDAVLEGVLNASSGSSLSFENFDTSAMIDLGRFTFTFKQLISGDVDVNAFGRKLFIERFEGPLSGELTDKQSGSLVLNPSKPLVLGPLSLHLGARSENLGPIDLGWGSLTMHETTRLGVDWQALPVAEDRPTGALSLTLSELYAKEAIATGLHFKTRLAGADVEITMIANGKAKIFNLNAPELKLEIAEEYFKVDGSITGDNLEAEGLLAQLGERLCLMFEASSDSIIFDALSDGEDRFRLDELVLSGNDEIAVSLQKDRPLRTWTFTVQGDLWGTIGDQGIAGHLTGIPGYVAGKPRQAQLSLGAPKGETDIQTEKLDFKLQQEQVPFDIGPGSLDIPGITVTFGHVIGTGKLGQPGDTPTSLGGLSLNDGAYSGNLPIIKLSDIKLTSGTIEIDDLSQWVDESDFQQLNDEYLKEFANAISGNSSFTIGLDGMLDPRAKVVINPVEHDAFEKIQGTYTWDQAELVDVKLEGSLLTSAGSGETIDTLYVFDSWALSGNAKWPPNKPIELNLQDKTTGEFTGPYNINGYSDVNFDLNLSATNIPIPGNGILRVDASSGQQVRLIGKSLTSNRKRLNINITGLDDVSVRKILFNMFDFEASGIHVKEATELKVDYNGLAVNRVYGEIVEVEIERLDIAEIPAFDPAAMPVSSIPTLFFKFNTVELSQDPAVDSEKRLVDAVALIKKQTAHSSGWRVVVIGYAGNEDQAASISQQRAARIAQVLNANGIDSSRIDVVGQGSDNSRPGQFNQRVEIIVVPGSE